MLKRSLYILFHALLRNRVYTVRCGLAKGLKRKGGLSFIPRELNAEERFLTGLQLNGYTAYDIGGWEGIFTLFFARAVGGAGKVVTFEPNPENYQRILDNVGINGFRNVEVRHIGLGKDAGQATLVFPREVHGEGSIHPDRKAQLIEQDHDAITIPVQLDSLDNQIATADLPAPGFIKIDVEGYEMQVIEGMHATLTTHTPTLFIELHNVGGDTPRILNHLLGYGYAILHVETHYDVTAANTTQFTVGHVYCTPARIA